MFGNAKVRKIFMFHVSGFLASLFQWLTPFLSLNGFAVSNCF